MKYLCVASLQVLSTLRSSHALSTITSQPAILGRRVPSVVEDPRQQYRKIAEFEERLVASRDEDLGISWYGYEDDDSYENDEEDDDDDFVLETSEFMELQRSTGSDIMDAKLQQQLDNLSHPNQFLDRHVVDATPMEKLAMSSMTQQLPRGAVDVLAAKSEQSNQSPKSTTTKKRKVISGRHHQRRTRKNTELPSSLQFANVRVSPEEEIQLARIIQKGAAMEATKDEAETKRGRELTRHEWADLVGLTARELRREIAQYRQAKHLLVNANIGLVGTVVNQHWAKNKNRYMGLSKEELIQEGSLGLLRAAELFDPSRGLRFSTYAVVWIKGVLSNSHIQELVRVPDRERRRWRKIQQAQTDLEQERDPKSITIQMLSDVTGLSPQDILFTQRKMQQANSVLSLDYEQASQSRSGTDTTMISYIQSDRAMQEEDMVERTQLQADIVAAMARNLDAREARLLRLRYGLSDGVTRSLSECADAMGLSYTRVHQLSKQCLKKLREAAEAESLQEYLLTIA
ncbi:hypothetical protein ACA910_000610 [Epithemia clementina (nom. ined.)]